MKLLNKPKIINLEPFFLTGETKKAKFLLVREEQLYLNLFGAKTKLIFFVTAKMSKLIFFSVRRWIGYRLNRLAKSFSVIFQPLSACRMKKIIVFEMQLCEILLWNIQAAKITTENGCGFFIMFLCIIGCFMYCNFLGLIFLRVLNVGIFPLFQF